MTVTPPTLTVGATSQVQVIVRDLNGNPLSGQSVTIQVTGTGNTVTQPAASTGADGIALASVSSTISEAKTVTAFVGGTLELVQKPTIQFDPNTPAPPSGTLSTAVASPSTGVVANGVSVSTVTITVRDSLGSPLAGVTAQIAATGTNNVIVQPSAPTDTNGQATATIASTRAETKTVTVTLNPGSSAVVLSTQPTVVFVGNAAAISPTLSIVSALPAAGVVANGTSLSTITVTVRDDNGNPVAGQVVSGAATGSNNTLAQPVFPTNLAGVTTATLASTLAETKSVTATVVTGGTPIVLASPATVGFVADAANLSPTLSTAVATPNTGLMADGSATSTITVTVLDVNGNPAAGQTVLLSASGSGNTLAQPASTDAAGVATGTLTSTAAETKLVTVTLNPGAGQVVLADTPSVEFVGNRSSISGALSTVVASPATGVIANGTNVSTITVTVRDGNGNPVAGQTVEIAATGSNNTVVQPAGLTNALGVATATLASITAETKTVTATVNPAGSAVALASQPTVQFVADPSTLSATLSTAVFGPATGVIANGIDVSTLTVTVVDANGNPVAGQVVELSASGSGNTVTQPVGPTNSLGVSTGSIASTIAEIKIITVTVDPFGTPVVLTIQPTVEFVGDPSTISATLSDAAAAPVVVIANGTDVTTITVTVRDANGNPVAGQTVQIAATGSNNTIVQPGPTDGFGAATGTMASTLAETKTITATVNPAGAAIVITAKPSVQFVGDPSTISASLSTAVFGPATGVIANGTDVSTLTVTVLDANGNPVDGQVVAFSASGTGNTVTQPAAPTNSLGVATGSIVSTVAETKVITVTINPAGTPVVLNTLPTVEFVADPSTISASLSSAGASPAIGVIANGTDVSTLSVTVIDANGNPVVGQVVEFSSSGTGNTLAQPAGPTNALGVATGSIASTVAETKVITVTINPAGTPVVLNTLPTVEFVADPSAISSSLSSAGAAPALGVIANGTDLSTLTVTVRDVNGNPVGGQVVSIAASGSNNTIVQPGLTNALGVATATIASLTAETKTVTVTVDPSGTPVVLATFPTVDFVGDPSAISASLSSAGAAPALGVVANGTDLSTLTVTVRDVNGNPVGGQTVEIAATGSNNTIVQPGLTNALGVATATLASITAETKVVTVTVDPSGTPVVLNTLPTVEFVADPSAISSSLSSAGAAPALGVVANGTDLSTITVTVLDVNGNPVSGQTVEIAATGSNNTIVQPGLTNALGVATATLASITAETKVVTVTVDPSGTPVVLNTLPTVEFVADPSAISGSLSSAGAAPATGVVANGTDLSTITVTVVDVNGNPVSGQTVEIAATGTNNTIVQPGLTNALGVATATLASITAETKTVTVTVDPTGTPVVLATLPTVEFVADPSAISNSLSSAGAAPALGVVANGTDLSTITVTVLDVNGNPVSGQTVEIAATGSNNTIVQPGLTNALGVATATLASITAETKVVTATVDPSGTPVVLNTLPTVEFVADPSAISASLSSAGAAPALGVVANGTDLSTLTVTVRDVNGNPVGGQTVEIAATGTNNTIVQPGLTNALGVATATIASITAETKTVTVTVDPTGTPVVLATLPTVEFVADPSAISASLSTVVVTPATGLPANGFSAATITVTVRDANGNPIDGRVVQLGATGTGNTLTQPSTLTNAAGVATGSITSAIAGSKTITATVDPLGGNVVLSSTPSVTFDPPALSATLSSATATPTFGSLADGADAVTVTIVARDTSGNPVAGQSVQIAATGSGNSITQPAGMTNAAGTATATLRTTRAELKTITVTLNPGASQVVLTAQPQAEFVWPLALVYYVRSSGSDANTGTSPAQAWRTIGRAALAVTAGATVYVGAGTYGESVTMTISGTAPSPIHFVADRAGIYTGDAGDVLVDGLGAANGFHVSGASNVRLTGFSVTGSQVGVRATGPASGLRLSGMQVWGNGAGIDVFNFTGAVLEDNVVSANGAAGPAVHVEATTTGVVRNNLVYGNSGTGLSLRGEAPLAESNTIHQNAGDNVYVFGTLAGSILRNNVITFAGGDGIELAGGGVLSAPNNLLWSSAGLAWNGMAAGAGTVTADPLFVDADGADNLLGGAQAADDEFQLGAGSPAFDAGSAAADTIAFADGGTLADRTSRTSQLLDGEAPDGDVLNLGHHWRAAQTLLAPLTEDDGRLVYGVFGSGEGLRQPRLRAWNDGLTTWSAPGTGLASGGVSSTLQGIVHEASPLANAEELVAVLSTNGVATELEIQRWDGGGWLREWSSSAITPAHAKKRAFDLAYENGSGDVLVVYTNGGATPLYRVRTAGVWSAEVALPLNDGGGPNPDLNTGAIQWLELESRQQTDEIALAYVDFNDDLVVITWDGTQWSTARAARLETNIEESDISGVLENRAFDLAYTGVGGDLMAAWGRFGQIGFVWSRLPGGSSTWSTPLVVSTGFGDESDFVDLAAEPGGDRVAIVMLDLEGSPERLSMGMWQGGTWSDLGEVVAQARDTNGLQTGDFGAAVGWVGSSGTAVVVFADDQAGQLDWVRWTAAGGWTEMTDVAIAGKGFTESVLIESFAGKDELMVVMSDSNSDLYAARYDGTSWTVTNGGTALETDLATTDSLPFSMFVAGQRAMSGMTSVQARVNASSDDAEDRAAGAVVLNGNDLELGTGEGNEALGLRFTALGIPQGATIVDAWIDFTVDETDNGATNLLFRCEAIDDAPTFTTTANNVIGRVMTTASVPWNPVPAWNTVGEVQSSPYLATIVQEVINRPGWTVGNDLVVIVTGTGNRVAESWDAAPTAAPILRIIYTP